MNRRAEKKRMKICKYVQEYIDIVRSGDIAVCEEQILMCDMLEDILKTEDVYFNEEQLERYLNLQQYFPYQLIPWERFCFAIHNTLYKSNGQLRFPILVIIVGRGAGKNGYLAFEDFALLTPVNGILKYNIDIFATAEDQAKTTFDDVYEILENDEKRFKGKFSWNKECIRNLKTGSELRFWSSNPKTKDSRRPGKVDFDEYHAYENYKLINVAVTGLGKKKHPRRTIISTQGDVRDGPFDKLLEKCIKVLKRIIPDNGTFPFICRLDSDEEIINPEMWDKANPSLRYFPDLQQEIQMEFNDYLDDPINNSAFATKRMNRPKDNLDIQVTTWENVEATNREVPDMDGWDCICGIDYASFDDFASVFLLFKKGDMRYGITHSWVCRESKDWARIQYPIEEAEKEGLLTVVKSVEIDPDDITDWIYEQGRKYHIKKICLDNFRYALMKKSLKKIGYEWEKGEDSKVHLIRNSDKYIVAPKVISIFNKHQIIWGNNSLMRWYTWNVELIKKNGNIEFGKIEEKSRKTDGFMAYVAALIDEDSIKERGAKRMPMGTLVF